MTISFHLLEPDEIFNFVFDPDGKTMYYTVVRDGMLWLRQATFGGEEPQLEDLVNLNIPKESSISETSVEHSRLMYKDGKLVIPNGFSWEAYCFTSFRVYTIASRKLQDADWDKYVSLMEIGEEREAQHFSTKSDQLYYRNGSKLVCVTDKLNLEEQKEEESIEYMQYSISPDGSKVAFGAMLMFGDIAHGPLCIANADGSQQQILVEDGVSDEQPTLWIGNRLFFIDVDDELTSENDNDCRTSLFTIDPSTNKRTRMFDRVRRFDIKQPAK